MLQRNVQRLEATAEPVERPTTGPKYAVHQVAGHPYNKNNAVVLNGQELDANVAEITTGDDEFQTDPEPDDNFEMLTLKGCDQR